MPEFAPRLGSIAQVGSTGYRWLGFAVWHGGRWYVRRRLRAHAPSRRALAAAALAVVAIAGAGYALREAS